MLAVEGDMYRLLNDFGEPTLHEVKAFECTCDEHPDFWVSIHDEGDDYDGPQCWNSPGYFEDWHDSVPDVMLDFERVIKIRYPELVVDLAPRKFR